MILVRITMHAREKNRKEVMQTLLSLIDPMGKERGCLSYDVGCSCNMEEGNMYSLTEEWETREDLDRHFRSKIFSVLLGAGSLLKKPSHIKIDTISHSETIDAVHLARGEHT